MDKELYKKVLQEHSLEKDLMLFRTKPAVDRRGMLKMGLMGAGLLFVGCGGALLAKRTTQHLQQIQIPQ